MSGTAAGRLAATRRESSASDSAIPPDVALGGLFMLIQRCTDCGRRPVVPVLDGERCGGPSRWLGLRTVPFDGVPYICGGNFEPVKKKHPRIQAALDAFVERATHRGLSVGVPLPVLVQNVKTARLFLRAAIRTRRSLKPWMGGRYRRVNGPGTAIGYELAREQEVQR